MTSLERNGDVVRLASYAPLLAREGRTQWRPDLIYFDNTRLLLSANYYVQQLFGQNPGDLCLPALFEPGSQASTPPPAPLSCSCVKDSKTGDLILKLVNTSPAPLSTQIDIQGGPDILPQATLTLLSADPAAFNTFAAPEAVCPKTTPFQASRSFTLSSPAHSLSVLRLKTK